VRYVKFSFPLSLPQSITNSKDLKLSISFPTQTSSSTYEFSLDPLFAPIDASKSSSKVLSTKIECVLRKATPGVKWHKLEGSEAPPTNQDPKPSSEAETVKRAVLAAPQPTATAPSYPTSSRTGPKNWDKLAADLTKKPKKAKAKDGDEDEDDTLDDYDDEGGDAVNAFFKKLYAGADPDTRRAMMKSYLESNGTSLSTNWSEVSKGPVETSPPDGMIAKKWTE
jgi:suppressor of G2 allele of SKP1